MDEKKKEIKENKKEENVEVKKFEVKNEKAKNTDAKTNKSRWITSVATVIVVLATAVLLTYMIVTSSDPKKTIDGFLTNLKAGDFEKAQEFISGEEFLKDNEFDLETKRLFFDKLSWKVTKVTKENDNATVEVEVTNKDFNVITSNWMKNVLEDFKAVLEGNSVEQNMEKYFIEELKNEQVQTTTQTKTIQLVKEDKKWMVVSNEELEDALLPGLQEAANSLGN